MTEKSTKSRSPWWWIPSLYYAEGLPYAIVMYITVVMYKKMGVSNAEIALYTSWLYLPWVIKPFWSPIVDVLKTKRFWVLAMQLIIGAALGSVALTIPLPNSGLVCRNPEHFLPICHADGTGAADYSGWTDRK